MDPTLTTICADATDLDAATARADGFSADDRIRIVLRGLGGGLSPREHCKREGVPIRLYYQWCMAFLEGGKRGLQRGSGAPESHAAPAMALPRTQLAGSAI